MVIKALSIVVLIHMAGSKPQFNFGGLPAELGGHLARVGGHLARVDGLPARLGELPARLRELPARLGELPARLGELPARLGELPARQGELPARQGELPARLGDFLTGNAANLSTLAGVPNDELAAVAGSPNDALSGIRNHGGLSRTPNGPLADVGLAIRGFGEFKSIFKKAYPNPSEEKLRQNIFDRILQLISSHNVLFKNGIEKYSLAINDFSDWTHSEYLEINGVDLSQVPIDGIHEENVRSRRQISSDICQSPYSKDWRAEGAVTPVKNQLKCGSCWAFSAAGALEGQFFLRNGVVNSLSEQQFIDCSKPLGNNGCHKGFMNTAFQYTQGDGIVTEYEYPYEAKDNYCRASPNSMKTEGVGSVPKGNEDELKDAVCRIGPIAAALDATDEKFMHYHDGVYFNRDCNPNNTTHAVLIIGYGYDESTELDYWLIKNSYGPRWGKGGYGKIARNEKNHCGIANLASYPIV